MFANPGSTACSHAASLTGTGLPSWAVTDSMGLGGHQRPALASVAPTLASSKTLVGLTPRVNEAWRWSLVTCAIERSVRRRVFGSTNGVVANDFMPSRTAMSTTSGTPVNSSSLMNAVLGEVASASCSDMWSA